MYLHINEYAYTCILLHILCCIFLRILKTLMHIFHCIFWHIYAYFLIHISAYFRIYLHISCMFLMVYFGIFIDLDIYAYEHIFCIFQIFCIFRKLGRFLSPISTQNLCREDFVKAFSPDSGSRFWEVLFLSSDFSRHTAQPQILQE